MPANTTILIVDDHRLSRKNLRYLFESTEKYKVTGEAGSGTEAMEWLDENTVDLVITDIAMPEMDGVALLRNIRQKIPDQKVIAMTVIQNTIPIKEMLSDGVNGYLLKNSSDQEILKALNQVNNGKMYLPMEMTQHVMDEIIQNHSKAEPSQTPSPGMIGFSKMERSVFKLLSLDQDEIQIADILGITPHSLSTLIQRLLIKTKTADRSALIKYAKNLNSSKIN